MVEIIQTFLIILCWIIILETIATIFVKVLSTRDESLIFKNTFQINIMRPIPNIVMKLQSIIAIRTKDTLNFVELQFAYLADELNNENKVLK